MILGCVCRRGNFFRFATPSFRLGVTFPILAPSPEGSLPLRRLPAAHFPEAVTILTIALIPT
ncbi:MAG: hypothetical protein KDE24_08895, partial [Caldilinea sp.]|nr:hypothetical protein [Caldilinea sp.]